MSTSLDPYAELTLYQRSAVLMAAANLGVFAALGAGAGTPEAIAARVSAPADSVGRLLAALAALDYVSRSGGTYALNAFSGAFLRDGRGGMARLAGKEHGFYTAWSRLGEALTGGALYAPYRERLAADPASVRRFLLALNDLAALAGPGVIATGALAGGRTLLDLGGGAGGYAGQIALEYPQARITLLDLPGVLPIAREHLEATGVAPRVELVAGDFLAKDGLALTGTFDRVFVSHVLHDFDAPTAAAIVARAARWVSPGGKLVILDVLVPDGGPTNPVEALFDLMMLVEIPGGRTHAAADVLGWVRAAGLRDPEVHPLYFGTLVAARAE